MSEFFLELFSEEIPANLQSNSRLILLKTFKNYLRKRKFPTKKVLLIQLRIDLLFCLKTY